MPVKGFPHTSSGSPLSAGGVRSAAQPAKTGRIDWGRCSIVEGPPGVDSQAPREGASPSVVQSAPPSDLDKTAASIKDRISSLEKFARAAGVTLSPRQESDLEPTVIPLIRPEPEAETTVPVEPEAEALVTVEAATPPISSLTPKTIRPRSTAPDLIAPETHEKPPVMQTPAAPTSAEGLNALVDRLVIDPTLPLFLVAPGGRVLRTNAKYDDLALRCPDLPRLDQSGASVPAAFRTGLEDVIHRHEAVVADHVVHVNGVRKNLRVRQFPLLDDTGACVAVGGTVTDITDQQMRVSEAMTVRRRFSDYARATSDWFWELDSDFRLTELSDRFTALVGRPAALQIGSRLNEIGTFARNMDREYPWVEATRGRRPFRDQLFEVVADDGATVLFHLSGIPVFDSMSGEFKGFRGAGTDMTVRYQAQMESIEIRHNLENTLEELTQKNLQLDIATAQAESALQAKNEFLAAMSHELRTPLNAIIGFAEAMHMQVFGELGEQYTGYCADIMNAGRHLLGLINDVLDGAVLESGGLTLNQNDVSLKQIVDQAANLIVMRAQNKNIDVSDAILSEDFHVFVDVRRATQIFVNLFTNAVKFTPEGGRIGTEVEMRGTDRVAVTVWDTGIGIPGDQLETVFEKFQQVTDTVYTSKAEGTGLGLHISRELARKMGGDVELTSTLEQGSRFTVTLPLAVSDTPTED